MNITEEIFKMKESLDGFMILVNSMDQKIQKLSKSLECKDLDIKKLGEIIREKEEGIKGLLKELGEIKEENKHIRIKNNNLKVLIDESKKENKRLKKIKKLGGNRDKSSSINNYLSFPSKKLVMVDGKVKAVFVCGSGPYEESGSKVLEFLTKSFPVVEFEIFYVIKDKVRPNLRKYDLVVLCTRTLSHSDTKAIKNKAKKKNIHIVVDHDTFALKDQIEKWLPWLNQSQVN